MHDFLTWAPWAPEVAIGLFLTLFSWAWKLSINQNKLQHTAVIHNKDIGKLEAIVSEHSRQLSSIEALREEFRSVAPDIKAMTVTLGKLDAILVASNRRLEIVEDRVFMQQGQQNTRQHD